MTDPAPRTNPDEEGDPCKDADKNLAFMADVKRRHDMSSREMARLTEYSEDYVRAWFAPRNGPKFRPVPDRAVTIVKLKQKQEGPLI